MPRQNWTEICKVRILNGLRTRILNLTPLFDTFESHKVPAQSEFGNVCVVEKVPIGVICVFVVAI